MRRFILGMAGLAMLTVGASSATAQYDRWNPYLELEGRAGDGIERGQGRAFIPVFQDNSSMLFGDIRLMYTDTQHFEGNFGLGYRKIISSNRIFGVYGFYDVRETHFDNVFHQGSAGAELLDTSTSTTMLKTSRR